MERMYRWEEVVERMGEPTKWFVNVHASMEATANWPRTLADSVNAHLKTVSYDAEKRSLTFELADRIFTYAFPNMEIDWAKNPETDEPFSISLTHFEGPVESCGSLVDGNRVLCIELMHPERMKADDARKKAQAERDAASLAKRVAELKAQKIAKMREMVAKVVPPLEQRLVGKRILAVGVENGVLVLICEDDISLKIDTREAQERTIVCSDIEINHLSADDVSEIEVRKRNR